MSTRQTPDTMTRKTKEFIDFIGRRMNCVLILMFSAKSLIDISPDTRHLTNKQCKQTATTVNNHSKVSAQKAVNVQKLENTGHSR